MATRVQILRSGLTKKLLPTAALSLSRSAAQTACFIGAMKAVAAQGGPKVPADASVTSTVGIGPRSEGGFGLDIALEVSLPGLAHADAEALVAKAHQVCPYSNATRGNVDVKLSVV